MSEELKKKQIEWRTEILSGYVKKAWVDNVITADVADYLLNFINDISLNDSSRCSLSGDNSSDYSVGSDYRNWITLPEDSIRFDLTRLRELGESGVFSINPDTNKLEYKDHKGEEIDK